MTVVTVMAVELMVVPMVVLKTVMTVYMTLPLMVVNVVILPGMNMALIVLILKETTTGIAQDVHALVMVTQYVVMVSAMVMRPTNLAHLIVMHLVNVMLVKLLTVMVPVNAGPKVGLVMVLQIAMTRLTVLT